MEFDFLFARGRRLCLVYLASLSRQRIRHQFEYGELVCCRCSLVRKQLGSYHRVGILMVTPMIHSALH